MIAVPICPKCNIRMEPEGLLDDEEASKKKLEDYIDFLGDEDLDYVKGVFRSFSNEEDFDPEHPPHTP